MEYSKHIKNVLNERSIEFSWVERTIEKPEITEERDDGTRHFLRQIPERENRWLRVIVNANTHPIKGVTAFFDRRVRRKNETKNR